MKPLRCSPWRLVSSGILFKATVHLVLSAALGLLTFVFVVLFPLLPLWVQVLAQIDQARSRLLLPKRVRRQQPFRWEWQAIGPRAASLSAWRQSLITLLDVLMLMVVPLLGTLIAMMFVVTFRVVTGGDVQWDAHRWLINPDSTVLQRVLGTLIALAILILLLHLVPLLATFQAYATRRLMDTAVLEQQVTRFNNKNTELIETFEAERQRIERELHDGPQQHLANAAIQLGLARSQLGPSAVSGQLEAAQQQIEEAAKALREALAGLRPRTLLEDGLEGDLREMAEVAPIDVAVNYGLSARLDPPTESSLHFVAGEFLSNTYRHAMATRASLDLSDQGGNVVLCMQDNGVGGADASRGTGLIGMANRAKLLGGHLEVSSPQGGPTVLRVSFPVRRKDARCE